MTIEVLVKLAGRDPWSFTVFEALRHKFGIAALAGVEKLKSWQLAFELDSDREARRLTAGILEGTALLANPNRDRWVVRSGSQPAVPEAFLGAGGRGRSVAVRVTDREDTVGRSMLDVLRRRVGLSQVGSVVYSLVWILRFDAQEEDCLDSARDIAVARGWRKGLLANPHFQDAVVRRIEEFTGKEA